MNKKFQELYPYKTTAYLNISSVHVGPADVGGSVPLAEEHVAPVGVDHDGARALQVVEQGAAVRLLLRAQHVQGPLSEIE